MGTVGLCDALVLLKKVEEEGSWREGKGWDRVDEGDGSEDNGMSAKWESKTEGRAELT